MRTVIVCGGRDFEDKKWLTTLLDAEHRKAPISLLVEGGAFGADRLARGWAIKNHVPHQTHEARWWEFEKAAGPIRNKEMLEAHPSAEVIAFPGGSGTANMVEQATKAGRSVLKLS